MALVGGINVKIQDLILDLDDELLTTEKIKIVSHDVPRDGNCFFNSFLKCLIDKSLPVNPDYLPVFDNQEILRKNVVNFMSFDNLTEELGNLIELDGALDSNSFQHYISGFLNGVWADNFCIQMTSEMMNVPVMVFEIVENDTVLKLRQKFEPPSFGSEITLEKSVLLLFLKSELHYNWFSILERKTEKMDVDEEPEEPGSSSGSPSDFKHDSGNINDNKTDAQSQRSSEDQTRKSEFHSSASLENFCNQWNVSFKPLNLQNYQNFQRVVCTTIQQENPCLNEPNLKRLIKELWKTFIIPVSMDCVCEKSTDEYCYQPWFFASDSKLQLKKFQLDAVNVMRKSWKVGKSLILGDEQGLGKTVQTITFLRSLLEEEDSLGPFLIVVPLSTLNNWNKEFALWAPDIVVVEYAGDPETREKIRSEKFNSSAQIILTTEDWLRNETNVFLNFKFDAVVLDEAHSLKDSSAKLVSSFKSLDSKFNLLLSGTPVQNEVSELFTLLNCLDKKSFNDLDLFLENFGNLNDKSSVKGLREILKHRMIRRISDDVLELPSLKIVTVRSELTHIQQQIYTAIQAPGSKKTKELFKQRNGRTESLANPNTQLRKAVNHPFLFKKFFEDAQDKYGNLDQKSLVKSSSKMGFLQNVLRKLKSQGHRVLVFSQMTKMLDLIEYFLEEEGHNFERLDGKTKGSERQSIIDSFNDEKSESFVLLLSTRAGGVGLNLQSADTVIIFDSDWNPHNDLQAIKRSHRFGQLKPVLVIRVITNSRIEEKVEETDARKIKMAELLLKNFDNDQMTLDLTGQIFTPKNDKDIDSILNRTVVTKSSKSVNTLLTAFPPFDPNTHVCKETGKSYKTATSLNRHRLNFFPFHEDFRHLFTGWLIHPEETGVWTNPGLIESRDFNPKTDQRLFLHYGYFLHKKDELGNVVERLWKTGFTLHIHSVHQEIKSRKTLCESLKAAVHSVNEFDVDWSSLKTLGYSDFCNGSQSIAQDVKFGFRSLSPISNYHNLFLKNASVSDKLKNELMDKMVKLEIPIWINQDPFPHSHPPYPHGDNFYWDQVLSARKAYFEFVPAFPGEIFEWKVPVVHPLQASNPCPVFNGNLRCSGNAQPGRKYCGSCGHEESKSKSKPKSESKPCLVFNGNLRCCGNAKPGNNYCESCKNEKYKSTSQSKPCLVFNGNLRCTGNSRTGRNYCLSCEYAKSKSKSNLQPKPCPVFNGNLRCTGNAEPGRKYCGSCRYEKSKLKSKPKLESKPCPVFNGNLRCTGNAKHGRKYCGSCRYEKYKSRSQSKPCLVFDGNLRCTGNSKPGRNYCESCIYEKSKSKSKSQPKPCPVFNGNLRCTGNPRTGKKYCGSCGYEKSKFNASQPPKKKPRRNSETSSEELESSEDSMSSTTDDE